MTIDYIDRLFAQMGETITIGHQRISIEVYTSAKFGVLINVGFSVIKRKFIDFLVFYDFSNFLRRRDRKILRRLYIFAHFFEPLFSVLRDF